MKKYRIVERKFKNKKSEFIPQYYNELAFDFIDCVEIPFTRFRRAKEFILAEQLKEEKPIETIIHEIK